MKRTLALAILLVLTGGCSKKAMPAAKLKAIKPYVANAMSSGEEQSSGRETDVLPPSTPIHQGKSAAQWGDCLQSTDPATRAQGCMALREMGEAGYPQLKEGLSHPSPEIRLTSLQGLYVATLLKHKDETLPLLRNLLHDQNSAIREQAAVRVAWFARESGAALPRLDQLAKDDPSPQVRSAAALSAGTIRAAVSGKIATD